MVWGNTSLLIEKTLIAYSAKGIASRFDYCDVYIVMKNVNIVNCGLSELNSYTLKYGRVHLTVSENLTMINSKFYFYHIDSLMIRDSRTLFLGGRVFMTSSSLSVKNSVVFFANTPLHLQGSTVQLNNSALTITENTPTNDTFLSIFVCKIDIVNGSSMIITDNTAIEGNTQVYKSSWNMERDCVFSFKNNTGLWIYFTDSNASLSGSVRIVNNSNTHSDVGVWQMEHSRVEFHGSLEVAENSAESGAITAVDSYIYITNRATFSGNRAANGGALTLISSFMHINSAVYFARNCAQWLGGAIYISKPKRKSVVACSNVIPCSIQVYPERLSLTFNQNKAGIAGNAIYGGYTSVCYLVNREHLLCSTPDVSDIYKYNGMNDSSDLSDFTSDPTRVCFCENDIQDCNKVLDTITVHPGEL